MPFRVQRLSGPRPFLFAVSSVAWLLWLNVAAAASLSGRVTDEGEPVVMAEVMLIDAASRELRANLFTDAEGAFHVSVPVGRYHLNVAKEDYADGWVRNIEVGAAGRVQDVELLLEAFAEPEGAVTASGSDDCD